MQTLQFKLTLQKQVLKTTSVKLRWLKKAWQDKSLIVNSIVTRNRYTAASRVEASLQMKNQLKIKLTSFG